MTSTTRPKPLLWLDETRGLYIPRDFANSFADRSKSVKNVDQKTWDILETGPEHELYWDTWANIKRDAVVIDENGVEYFIYQDGNCWLIPIGMTFIWSTS